MQSSFDYLPFGGVARQTSGGEARYQFTGQELDEEAGLQNFRVQLYDAGAAIFHPPLCFGTKHTGG